MRSSYVPFSSPRSMVSSTCFSEDSTSEAVARSGPSSSKPARPWTADQAAISAPGLRCGSSGFVEYLAEDLEWLDAIGV